MVVDTRHKWDVLISYSWMDVIPTHNGRFYWRPPKIDFVPRRFCAEGDFVPRENLCPVNFSLERECKD